MERFYWGVFSGELSIEKSFSGELMGVNISVGFSVDKRRRDDR